VLFLQASKYPLTKLAFGQVAALPILRTQQQNITKSPSRTPHHPPAFSAHREHHQKSKLFSHSSASWNLIRIIRPIKSPVPRACYQSSTSPPAPNKIPLKFIHPDAPYNPDYSHGFPCKRHNFSMSSPSFARHENLFVIPTKVEILS
jgi:hypothetical protein